MGKVGKKYALPRFWRGLLLFGILAHMNEPPDQYLTVAARGSAETKVQGSRFLAVALPVQTREAIDEFLTSTRRELHNATHHCFAYRLGTDAKTFRYSDDGEPAGSAGKPILAAIDKHTLTDTLVVVTRYFGGTKLGVGGLVRAYGGAAEAALAAAGRTTKYITSSVAVSFPHAHISTVMHVVEKYGGRILETTYDEDVHLHLEIRRSQLHEVTSLLINQTKGNIAVRPVKPPEQCR